MDDEAPTPLFAGRYRLLRRVGRGGMSDVHLARDEVLDRDVAVKLVRADRVDGTDGVARLEREARATARLSHPNVVVVHDVFREGDRAAVVMELVDGVTLADRIHTQGRLPWHEAARIVARVADGLGAAHAAGLVHRDVKPSNVLLGPGDRVRVADFGIATTGASTVTTTVRGSIPYLAPEQARGEPTDARTDVYSLGCVLYEALTGRVPFDGGTGAATIGQHLHRPPPRPADVVPDLPVGLDEIVGRMLAKEPGHRPGDMATVARALDDVRVRGAGATAVLPPAPTARVTSRPDRRPAWRWGATAVAGIGVALLAWRLAGTGGTTPPAGSAPPDTAAAATTAPDAITSPRVPTGDPATTVASPTTARPATVTEAATAFRRVLVAGRDAGQVSAEAVEELDDRISELVRKADEGKDDEVRKKARELVDHVDELADEGELTSPELVRRLRDAARDLRSVA